MIEEDVFIPQINTLLNIDNKYSNEDLLSMKNEITYEKRSDWHWKRIFNDCRLNLPYASSMICSIRVSNKLMICIKNYVDIQHIRYKYKIIKNRISKIIKN